MSPEIKKMFDAVKNHQKKSFPFSFDNTKKRSLNDLLRQREKNSLK